MKKTNFFWAIIPARSGSKSIKDKNIVKINNHPLIAYSILEAKKVKKIKKILVSSDSKKYLKIAKKYGADILHLRSKKNSSDKSKDLDFFKEVNNYIFDNFKKEEQPNFFIHLRPTSAIRNFKTINKGINLFSKNLKKYTSMRSVEKLSESSYKHFEIVNNKLKGVGDKSFNIDKQNNPKENFKSTFKANGYIDIVKRNNIKKNILHGSKSYPFIIKEPSIDIDGKDDLKYAKYLFESLKYYKNYKHK